jgi:hypothetical protein
VQELNSDAIDKEEDFNAEDKAMPFLQKLCKKKHPHDKFCAQIFL